MGAAVDNLQSNVHRWVPIWFMSHSVLFSVSRHLDIYFAFCSSYKYLEWFKPLVQREDKLQQTNGILEASRLLLYFVAKPHCLNCKGEVKSKGNHVNATSALEARCLVICGTKQGRFRKGSDSFGIVLAQFGITVLACSVSVQTQIQVMKT